jgi:hypothetical protein
VFYVVFIPATLASLQSDIFNDSVCMWFMLRSFEGLNDFTGSRTRRAWEMRAHLGAFHDVANDEYLSFELFARVAGSPRMSFDRRRQRSVDSNLGSLRSVSALFA